MKAVRHISVTIAFLLSVSSCFDGYGPRFQRLSGATNPTSQQADDRGSAAPSPATAPAEVAPQRGDAARPVEAREDEARADETTDPPAAEPANAPSADPVAEEPRSEVGSEGAPEDADDDQTGPDSFAPSGPAIVGTSPATQLGQPIEYLVDAAGRPLYRFMFDAGSSTCFDACAQERPPLLTEGDPVAVGSAFGSLLGTVDRDDGTVQVTYNRVPLYRFVGDVAPGDIQGQEDLFVLLHPNGGPIIADRP